VQGYLGQYDSDYFEVTIPGKPAAQADYKEYRVTVKPSERFELVGLAVATDARGNELEAYSITQGDDERKVPFSVKTTDDFDYLNDDPDGAGAYTITIKAL